MLLLALDTATPAVTVALHDGRTVVAESTTVDARRHGELLLPAVDRVLAERRAARSASSPASWSASARARTPGCGSGW